MKDFFKHISKWLLVALVVGVIFIVVGIIFWWKSSVTIIVKPETALIKIHDQISQGTLKTRLKPGTYSLKITLDSFIPLEEQIKINYLKGKTLEISLREFPKPQKLSDHQVQFITFDQQRSSLLYLEPNQNTAYRLFINNLDSIVSDPITPNSLESIGDLIWSPNRQLAFLKQNGQTKQYDFKRYDLLNQEVHEWPNEVKSIDWRNDNEKVIYHFRNGNGENSLVRASIDNSNQERIYNLLTTNIDNPIVKWSPNDQKILLLTDRLFVVDVFTKTLTELKTKDTIKNARWLPDSNQILFQTQDDNLNLITIEGVISDLKRKGSLDRLYIVEDGSGMVQAQSRGGTLMIDFFDFQSQQTVNYLFKTEQDLFPTNLLFGQDPTILFFTSEGIIYSLVLDAGRYELEN